MNEQIKRPSDFYKDHCAQFPGDCKGCPYFAAAPHRTCTEIWMDEKTAMKGAGALPDYKKAKVEGAHKILGHILSRMDIETTQETQHTAIVREEMQKLEKSLEGVKLEEKESEAEAENHGCTILKCSAYKNNKCSIDGPCIQRGDNEEEQEGKGEEQAES